MAIYDYTSGGFPASPASGDTLAMKGTTYSYNGSAWEVQTAGTTSYTYTATSGQTAFTGADTGSKTLAYTSGNVHVFLNGVLLDAADYTATSGTTITLATGAVTGDTLRVVAYGVLVASGGGGAMELISTTTVTSATASVSFTGLSADSVYKLVANVILSDGERLRLNVSSDNGSTYKTDTNYKFQGRQAYTPSTAYNGYNQDSSLVTSGLAINFLNSEILSEITFSTKGIFKYQVTTSGTDTTSSNSVRGWVAQGVYDATLAVNAISLTANGSQTISSGTLSLYKIKDS